MGIDPIDQDEASAPTMHLFAAQRHPIGASITPDERVRSGTAIKEFVLVE
jgi:hypothetical protein